MALPLAHFMDAITYRGVGAPNITQRVRIPSHLLNDSLLFHKYVVVDGDRPETVAHHYYGSAIYDWVVLLSNEIINVREEWPLEQNDLNDHLAKTFGSVDAAQEQIAYYKIDKTKDPISEVSFDALPGSLQKYWSKRSGSGDSVVYQIRPTLITLTPESFDILPEGEIVYWEPVSEYDKAFEANEAKRAIRLIDAQAVPNLERTLRAISTNG